MKIKGFKGFDKDLKCQNFQYEKDEEYEHKGGVKCCPQDEDLAKGLGGFHFCEFPFDVFGYYAPADSRYCEVEGDGEIDRNNDGDSKVAVSRIKINAEIGLPGIIKAGVEYIKSKVDWDNAKESNTGDRSAATNTGYRSAATNTGDQSAATNTGYQSAATVEGKESIAMSMGIEGKAKGSLGCYIVLAEWKKDKEWNWHIKNVKSAKVDGEKIKANTFYMLVGDEFVEAK